MKYNSFMPCSFYVTLSSVLPVCSIRSSQSNSR